MTGTGGSRRWRSNTGVNRDESASEASRSSASSSETVITQYLPQCGQTVPGSFAHPRNVGGLCFQPAPNHCSRKGNRYRSVTAFRTRRASLKCSAT